MNRSAQSLRLLIVEDNTERIKLFREWCPEDVKIVTSSTVGSSIGLLRRDKGRVYAGILLDHDLQEQAILASDKELNARDFLDVLITEISKDVPILVHSMNLQCAPIMVTKLESAGFFVTREPMDNLNREKFLAWLVQVQDWWETD